jgi:methylated-DNA-[protein]-cysteine S-methyltransferase
MQRAVVESAIGGIGVGVDGDAVCGVSFGAKRSTSDVAEPAALLADAVRQLSEYFAGERTSFDVPYVITTGTEFERAVWVEIAKIPYGQTTSYGAIARAVGDPSAAQAVGLACNHNPVPLIVPCHRVIGSDGKLVGFGGGIGRKRWLLTLETRVAIERAFAPD